jgi:hypothetical protein
LCPAGYVVGETPAGSAVLCRVTGRVVATGTDPSSLQAFCCNRLAAVRDISADGEEVKHGYQFCPVWQFRRDRELREKQEFPEGTPDRVKEGWAMEMINPA